NWFWFLPLSGQYGVAAGRIRVETKDLPQIGRPVVLMTDPCRRRNRKMETTEPTAIDLAIVTAL
ncbi:unnamed protein product, partial [Rotaria socialis]